MLQGVVTLTVVISMVLIVEGVIRIFTAIGGGTTHRGLVAVVGVISILLGLWLWSGIPVSGVAMGFFVGFELLLAGIVWIVGGWMSRSLAPSSAAFQPPTARPAEAVRPPSDPGPPRHHPEPARPPGQRAPARPAPPRAPRRRGRPGASGMSSPSAGADAAGAVAIAGSELLER